MHCPSRRPSLDISIHPRFGDTGLTPPLLIPKRVAIFFIEQNKPSSNRHRSRLVWVKGKNTHSTLSCDYFNCHNCPPSTGHLWNRKKHRSNKKNQGLISFRRGAANVTSSTPDARRVQNFLVKDSLRFLLPTQIRRWFRHCSPREIKPVNTFQNNSNNENRETTFIYP